MPQKCPPHESIVQTGVGPVGPLVPAQSLSVVHGCWQTPVLPSGMLQEPQTRDEPQLLDEVQLSPCCGEQAASERARTSATRPTIEVRTDIECSWSDRGDYGIDQLTTLPALERLRQRQDGANLDFLVAPYAYTTRCEVARASSLLQSRVRPLFFSRRA
jgi:hypothetical protein